LQLVNIILEGVYIPFEKNALGRIGSGFSMDNLIELDEHTTLARDI
jgi:ATP-dependent DNA ligase